VTILGDGFRSNRRDSFLSAPAERENAPRVTESFSRDWLTLREPFDAAARSITLARRFAAALPARPRVLDLGAGSGSMFRWLAPIIAREQRWVLADADAALLATVESPIAEPLIVDLVQSLEALPFSQVDGVVCSALLDLVSAPWLQRLAARLCTPFFACLNVDGRDELLPPHALDAPVLAAFRSDQSRDKGFGLALGLAAPETLSAALTARGFRMRSEKSDWRIPATAKAMLRELVHGYARVAGPSADVEAWRHDRLEQIDREKLAIRIGHEDILALPA